MQRLERHWRRLVLADESAQLPDEGVRGRRGGGRRRGRERERGGEIGGRWWRRRCFANDSVVNGSVVKHEFINEGDEHVADAARDCGGAVRQLAARAEAIAAASAVATVERWREDGAAFRGVRQAVGREADGGA